MDIGRWLKVGTRQRTVLILAALISTFAGADLLLNRPKGSGLEWFAIPLLASGGAVFAWAVWPKSVTAAEPRRSLAGSLIQFLSWRGQLVPFFPILGVGVIIADLAYNAALSATPALLTEDTIVLAAAVSLIAYGFVPGRFGRERDFVLVFFVALNAILVVPLLVARVFYADFERSVDVYSWVALAPQTSAVLNLLGVSNSVHSVAGTTAPGLTFMPKNLGIQVTVIITTACSGIYSFGIFASAFIAFVLTEYNSFSGRVWGLLGLGFLAAYGANVLRMVAIVLVGYYTDTPGTDLQNMLIAHSYAGWLIFLAWIALFWTVVFRFLGKKPARATGREAPAPRKRGVLCGICSDALTPALPGYRCECGKFYHVACAVKVHECPMCHARMPESLGVVPSRPKAV
jgi:exosortase/archaeosortase family protein